MRTREEKLEYAKKYYREHDGKRLAAAKAKKLEDRRRIAAAILAYEILQSQETNGGKLG